uniref:Integrase catalytic domain-containing protein n=1 Tax=Fagus sylvatica TaxID=28930 RepID=A0A2N9GVX2_FAGSY
MSNLMSTKLDSSNYMIWKLQITTVLDAYSMLEHLDGSIPKPNQFLTTKTGIQAVNPDFLVWNKKDKALLTLLYSTCSFSVLAMVVGKSSSQEVWNTLEESTYLQRIKTVRDKLSAVGVHSDHEELIHVILKGLPKEYAPFASAIRTRDTILPLEKLSVLLQTEEQSMSEATESLSNSALAMFVSHNKPSFNGNHGFNRGRGRNSYSRGRSGGGRNFNQGFSSPNTSTPQYQQQQICWKMGHYAIDCYHRMNFAYQGKNPTTKLAAMASASNLQYTQNAETWLTDTGATDHITTNASNLSPQSPYQGQEQVSVGNGQNLPIQNIDNNCSCYFDAKKFLIQDLPTGWLLYKGLSNNGVYPIHSSLFIPTANKTACAAHSISSDKCHLWHSILGHPSAKVLANVFPCFNTSSNSKVVQEHCHHCLVGKMHQLPFPTSNKTVTSPFELIHADLWGPAPVVASNSFRFYLVFVDEFTKFTWVYLLKHKFDTFQVFTQFRAMIDTQFSLPIKILRTDCGGTNRVYTSRHVLFNEKVFPGLKHPTVNSSQFPASPSVDSWLNILLLQHTCSHNSMVISPTSHESNTIPPSQCPLPTAFVPVPIPDHTTTYSSLLPTAPILDHTVTYSSPLPTVPIPDHTASFTSPTEPIVSLLSHMPLPTGFTNNPAPISITSIPTFLPTNPVPNLNSKIAPLTDNTHSTDMPLPHTHLPLTVPHPMQTRSKSGIFKPKLTYAALIDYALTEPTSYTVASKHSSWCTAMDEEFQALQKQGTWSLVPLPPSKNVVGCKWVYKLKTHSDDDIVLTSNTSAFLDTLIHKLSSVFDLKDLGSLHYFLGLQVTRTPSSCPNTRLSLHDGDPLPDPHAYRSMVGALHYLTFTRPDISFVVHQVCQYMSTPTTTHLAAAKRVLKYIRGTFNHGIEFTPGPLSLSAYTDADWAGDPDDRRSTSGFLVYLGHNAITWSTKKQATVSRSFTESEYHALAIAFAELCWIRSLLKDLGIYLPDPPTLWCDNISALAIASNPVFHARTKHIEVDFHFVRERVLCKDLMVKFVSTVDQLADIFTKSLSTHRFLELRRNLTITVPKIEGG